MKWLVVIPTIRQDRPGFDEVMARIQATFTEETEFQILDGRDGKPAALNHALTELLRDQDFYVTMDDDYVPGAGWQEVISQAFLDLPRLGLASLWVGGDLVLQELVGAHRIDHPRVLNRTRYRLVQNGHHIAGAFHVYRAEAARHLGPQPITGQKYQVWEDAWRGRRVKSAGYELAFIEGAEPEFIEYADPPEYLEWRKAQVELSRQDQDRWLNDSGIPDPLWLRLRRWVARVRGRAK